MDPGLVHGRGRDALAGELGGDALADLALFARIDQRVQLALAEHVDESGGEREIVQVDAAPRLRFAQVADRRDGVAADADVGPEPGGTGAVDHAGPGEDQIERDAEEKDHAEGATTITPSSPCAPSTTARTGSARRASVASSTSAAVTSLVV